MQQSFIVKYLVVSMCLICLFPPLAFSQENEEKRAELLITFGSLGILNTHPKSAPSPIQFFVGAGSQIKLTNQISLNPHAQFFANYYVWEDEQVLPSPIEHRSAYIPSIMLDIPVTYDIRTKNSIFKLGASPSFLFRFAFLANNVPSSEQVNIDKMNEWFWQSAEFFYPSVQFSWDYILKDGMSMGLGLKAYLPVGSLIKGNGINNGIASVGVRLGMR